MPDPHTPYLADALARFRAAADAAVERGRRAVDEAHAAGARFQRESEALQRDTRDRDAGNRDAGNRPTDPDLRAAADEYRTGRGLPMLAAPEKPRQPPDDEDFSQYRIMRPL